MSDAPLQPTEMLFIYNAVIREILREISRLSGADGTAAIDALLERVSIDLANFKTRDGERPLDRESARRLVRSLNPANFYPVTKQ